MDNLIGAQEKIYKTKLSRFRKRAAQDPNYIPTAANQVYKKLVDDITLEIVSEFHQAHTLGYAQYMYYPLENTEEESNNSKEEVVETKYVIECPNCSQSMVATRFAGHLLSCLGGRRNSKRIASKRNANSSKGSMYVSIPTEDEDEECNMTVEKPSKPSKKSDNGKRNKKHSKKSSSQSSSNQSLQSIASTSAQSDDIISTSKIKNLPVEDRMALLSTYCSPKSDSPSKISKTKSHSETERTVTRKLLSSSLLDNVVSGNFINIQDLDLPPMESEMDIAVSLSPADSNSSLSSSSSSHKRKSK